MHAGGDVKLEPRSVSQSQDIIGIVVCKLLGHSEASIAVLIGLEVAIMCEEYVSAHPSW
jgi:hypothetical protein